MSSPTVNDVRPLLVELLCEELPPKALRTLGVKFAELIEGELVAQDLIDQEARRFVPVDATKPPPREHYATPRRLAVLLHGVRARAPARAQRHKLMPVSVAIDGAGQPTPALLKKLAALGAGPEAVPALVRQQDGKSESLFLDTVAEGVALPEGLQRAIDKMLAQLPIPKVMTYQLADGWSDVRFVRPAHSLVALHGSEVVEVKALGLTAGRHTAGHRFEAAQARIEIREAGSYAGQLADEGSVIASFEQRQAEIGRQLAEAAAREGLRPIEDPALLDEVTSLVELPNVLACRFEEQFLAVPQECLILTMKANQKYFPLLAEDGRLTNRFLVVSNIRPEDPSSVIQGNERVVRPRLADAKFFFDQDRKRSLADRVPGLARVVYHGKLGSQGERVERVRAIARAIAAMLAAHYEDHGLVERADTAARLAKADLLTDMVGEFPELQGIMGGYYARHDGLGDELADAIEDHYRPRFAGDSLPRNRTGLAVALADKLETLTGLFGIGQVPTGDRDPFALRRHALGVIRMLVEAQLPLELDTLLGLAVPAFGALIADPRAELATFIQERLAGSLREQGYAAREVDAVLALAPQRLAEVPRRLEAVRAFSALAQAEALAAANKRIANILKKSTEPVEARVTSDIFTEPAERALWAALGDVGPRADALFERGEYTSSLQALSTLRAPVVALVEPVLGNADDPAVRANRLGLLATLHRTMNRVADLSRLSA